MEPSLCIVRAAGMVASSPGQCEMQRVSRVLLFLGIRGSTTITQLACCCRTAQGLCFGSALVPDPQCPPPQSALLSERKGHANVGVHTAPRHEQVWPERIGYVLRNSHFQFG